MIQKLPLDLQYLILEYVRIDYIPFSEKKYYMNNYKFDIDFIYFYVEPYIFIIDDELQVSISSWFGVESPEKFSSGKILHTIFERPYCINLENSFGKIAQIIYDKAKKFKCRQDISKDLLFAGTYGPIRKCIYSCLPFHIAPYMHNHYSTRNILDYFKQMNVVDKNVENLNLNTTQLAIKKLKELIFKSIINIINIYNKTSKNIISEFPIFKKIRNRELLFFKLCKPINIEKILKKQFIKKIINN